MLKRAGPGGLETLSDRLALAPPTFLPMRRHCAFCVTQFVCVCDVYACECGITHCAFCVAQNDMHSLVPCGIFCQQVQPLPNSVPLLQAVRDVPTRPRSRNARAVEKGVHIYALACAQALATIPDQA